MATYGETCVEGKTDEGEMVTLTMVKYRQRFMNILRLTDYVPSSGISLNERNVTFKSHLL